MFEFIKKIFKKETKKMTTLEEIKKAYEDLSEEDKKSFKESIQDRIDESIGEQEKAQGQTDTQSAKDREDEALGAEHKAGEGEVDELHETDPESHGDEDDVKHEKAQDEVVEEHKETDDARFKALENEVAELKAMVMQYKKQPKETDSATAARLDNLSKKYE